MARCLHYFRDKPLEPDERRSFFEESNKFRRLFATNRHLTHHNPYTL